MTMTHLVTKALGDVLAVMPEIRGTTRLGSYDIAKQINLSVMVSIEKETNLG